jgi:hypothetical protein
MSWRNLLTSRRGAQDPGTAVARVADVWEKAGRRASASLPTMAEVEASALKVYADHGLPTKPGHYRRGPVSDAWDYLGEDVDIARRWDMVLERPTESGWKFATLEDLGRHEGASAELRAASALLSACRHLKDRMTGRAVGDPGDDIERAIRLGVDWQRLKDAQAWKESSRLKLTTPEDDAPEPPIAALPAAKSKAAPKPRAPRKSRRTTGQP